VAGVGGPISQRSDNAQPAPSSAERAFDSGFAALRSGDPSAAAAHFARAAALGGPGLAEDSAFWRAVALDRAGGTADARAAYASFLGAYPASPRAGEAAVALGWLELDADLLDAADAHFALAAHDSSARVRASAENGLRAVAHRR